MLALLTAPWPSLALTTHAVDLGRGSSLNLQIPVPEADQLDAAAQIMGITSEEVGDQLSLLRGFSADPNALPTSAKMSAVVWPASQSLASLLTHCPSFVKDCRVLEVGCGLGTPPRLQLPAPSSPHHGQVAFHHLGTVGIAAAMAGATSVLLTDLDEGVLAAVGASADLNGVGSLVHTAQLDVTQYDLGQGALSEHGPFDLIIGSDVLFSASLTPLFAKFLAELLRSAQSQGGGELEARVMLADPLSRGNRALLEAAGAAQGLAYGEMPLPQILPGLEDCVLVNMVLAEEI